jgi:hypothetical protein
MSKAENHTTEKLSRRRAMTLLAADAQRSRGCTRCRLTVQAAFPFADGSYVVAFANLRPD